MAKGVKFSHESAKRIAGAVRKVEGGQSIPPLSRANFGTGEGWRLLIGKADSAITKGTSGTISIWDGVTQGSESDTGENITAWCRFGDVASGAWVGIKETVRGYEIVIAECP